MMTSSNGNIFRVLAIRAGNSPVPGECPTQRPVTRSFDVFFDLRPNKRLSKHWWGWWFETPSCPLWRHCNDYNTSVDVSNSYICSSTTWTGGCFFKHLQANTWLCNHIDKVVKVPSNSSASARAMVRLTCCKFSSVYCHIFIPRLHLMSHDSDGTVSAMAFQINGVTIVYSTVCDQWIPRTKGQ